MAGPSHGAPHLSCNKPLLFVYVPSCVRYYRLYSTFHLVLQVYVLFFSFGFPFSVSSAASNFFVTSGIWYLSTHAYIGILRHANVLIDHVCKTLHYMIKVNRCVSEWYSYNVRYDAKMLDIYLEVRW